MARLIPRRTGRGCHPAERAPPGYSAEGGLASSCLPQLGATVAAAQNVASTVPLRLPVAPAKVRLLYVALRVFPVVLPIWVTVTVPAFGENACPPPLQSVGRANAPSHHSEGPMEPPPWRSIQL